jgi:hypothetical protein
MKTQGNGLRRLALKPWLAGVAACALAIGLLAACSVNVPLGVDPNSDAAAVDASDGGGGN